MTIAHEIRVVAAGKEVVGWQDYDINVDMLQPADSFSIPVRFTREAWDLLRPDQAVAVYVDDTRILSGFIDSRRKTSSRDGGTVIQIEGRDKTGRLVDESASLFSYGGLKIKELAEELCGDLFERVTLVNAPNRFLTRGPGEKARSGPEPSEALGDLIEGGIAAARGDLGKLKAIEAKYVRLRQQQWVTAARVTSERLVRGFQQAFGASRPPPKPRVPKVLPPIIGGPNRPKRVPAGRTRWAVLEEFLQEARLLAWSTADGRELFIGIPHDTQEPQYYFLEVAADSARAGESNCSIEVMDTIADRYSSVTVLGANTGTAANYGENVTKNYAVARDNPDTDGGEGIDFLRPKRLVVQDDGIKGPADALERADREMLMRDQGGHEVIVRAPGHSQLYGGTEPTLYAIDTIARVDDESTGILGDYRVVSVRYAESLSGGTTTELRLVPRETVLML